jgi:lactate racemase
MVLGIGYTERALTEAEVRDVFARGLAQIEVADQRLLVIIPDGTRSAPMPLCFRLLTELLSERAARLDFLIALGTHPPMDEARLLRHLGLSAKERATRYAHIGIYNHDWQGPLWRVGTLSASEVHTLSSGQMDYDVPVEVNARLRDYDRIIICAPVFPHEMAGYSGGCKYFFPGVSGPAMIDFTHWLGAAIGNLALIGQRDVPTRRAIDRAASLIPVAKSCFSLVVAPLKRTEAQDESEELVGLYFGSPEESQAAAAELSSQVNVVYVDRLYQTVLAVMPTLYDDLCTASKGVFKTEPIVADGGTVIVYAPHITEISYTHKLLDRVGYHCAAYFLAQMERFRDVPLIVLAESAHTRGAGTYVDGVEHPRINVVLATSIARERCERVNLGYMDPATIVLGDWVGRADTLVVPHAGEVLYRCPNASKSGKATSRN